MLNSTRMWLIALCVGCSSAVPSSAQTVEKTTSLTFTGGANLDTSNDSLRLQYEYVQDANKPICMEAERASLLRFTAGKGQVGKDEQASGGLSVAYVDHAEFHFTVTAAGRYTAWYRDYFPWAGTWNHSENMDGGNTNVLTDSQGETLNQWMWTKGPTYELTAGKHSWNFTPYAWCGGTRLDKVVLVPEGDAAPSGMGAVSTKSVSPASGEILSEEVSRKSLIRWGGLKLQNASGKGTVSVTYSTDAGGTWNGLPATGDLSTVPPDKGIIFRLTLAASADGASPFLTQARVSYAVKSVPELALENDKLRVRFSGENGALLGIHNKVTKADYVVPDTETPLFSFMAVRGEYGTPREIGFTQAELKKVTGPSKGAMTLAYEFMGGGLLVNLRVRLEDKGLVRFSMDVTNKTIYNICEVKFPMLRGLRIGDDPSDDFLCTPILSGGIAKYPAALKFPRLVFTDRPLLYPGQATMCWMDLWDAKGGGLYLGCEDKEYRVTELTFSTESTERQQAAQTTAAPLPPTEGGYIPAPTPGEYINLGFDKHLLISKSTGTVRVPDVVIGVHEGDWHWGADRYREWAESWMVKTMVPDWFRDTEGWVDIHMTHLGTFVDLAKGHPHGNRRIAMTSPPFPMFATWAQQTSAEAYWSTPVLHRLLGNEEEFAGGIQKQHETGHYISFYNLPPRINPVFTREAKRAGIVPLSMIPGDEVPPVGFYPEVAQRRLDGSLVDPDGIYSEAGTCMGATKWRDYLDHIVLDKYIRQWGSDGMYLDGIGLVTYDCANLNHGHKGYGEWSLGLNQWLEHLKTEACKVRPGAVFSGEGMNDVDHRYLDAGLFYMDNAPQVYRYTFPRNIGVVHGAPADYYKEFPMDGGWLEFAAVFGLKQGGVSFCVDKDPIRLEQVIKFRKKFSQFQSRARFVDDVGLHISDPKVKAKLYIRDEPGTKGSLVVAYNGKEKASVTVSVDARRVGALSSSWVYTLDGQLQKLPVRKQGGQYQFTLPASRLSAVLLLKKCEPLIYTDEISPVVPGESRKVMVTLCNLNTTPFVGKVMLQLPQGWKSDSRDFRIAAGESNGWELTFTVPPGIPYDVYDLYAVTREAKRETKKCVPVGVCHPVQAEIHYLKGDTVRVEMVNVSSREVSGVCNLKTPPTVSVDQKDVAFSLLPGGKGEVIFHMGNVETITTREHIKAVLKYGSDETVAYELIQPLIPNGGFEQCLAGDGFPDYWNYRAPETLYLKGAALDATDPAEGKQCLRIDPYENEANNFLATTMIRLVPNTRYRISLKIKRSAHHPGIGVRFFSMYAKDNRTVVDVNLGNKTAGPTNLWEKFEGEFTTPDIEVPYEMLLLNSTKGAATVWFDDIRCDEVQG